MVLAFYGYLGISIATLSTLGLMLGVYAFRLKPTRSRLQRDLKRLASVIPLGEFLQKDYAAPSVVQYYASTTFRDYKLLALATGSIAMHSLLKPARSMPYRCGHLKQLLYVVAQMGDAVHGGKVLEVGFGKGANSIFLADLFPNANFLGIDVVEEHVSYANDYGSTRGLTNVAFTLDDASTPSAKTMAEGPFDLIFGVESFCHLDSEEKLTGFLRFARQCLKPNGRLVIVDGYRSASFENEPEEVQHAMMLAESGFRIRAMPSKPSWQLMASTARLTLVDDVDLTPEALAFWTQGWKVAHVLLLLLPWAVRAYVASSLKHAETGANFVSVATTAYAMALGSAVYGVLVFKNGS
ncbi:hypothetical protein TSOC_006021 [Tetrabaena socialis]|uniref:Methyltransferase domain-containing protein n=1 Tax=Tetrabaena socialis TaxID=47790 RepID=A0A2J8A4S5_9CHLO|nr:hypothetical protein TSOC_006021 [Tetrabaena socialis]|eukprot:PNH07519.1 hypothetical protein TSOC_006021 [Tetrabaena socialis]